jgi:hypothetical protein
VAETDQIKALLREAATAAAAVSSVFPVPRPCMTWLVIVNVLCRSEYSVEGMHIEIYDRTVS